MIERLVRGSGSHAGRPGRSSIGAPCRPSERRPDGAFGEPRLSPPSRRAAVAALAAAGLLAGSLLGACSDGGSGDARGAAPTTEATTTTAPGTEPTPRAS